MDFLSLGIFLVLFAIPARKYGFRKTLTALILFVCFIGGGIITWAFVSGNIP